MAGPEYHYWTHRPRAHGGTDPTGPVVLERKIFTETALVTTGDGKLIWMTTDDLDRMVVSRAEAWVTTVSSSGAVTVQIRNVTQAWDILSTKITIDASEFTSYTAA